ncbi:hypothetical protein, partial [Mycolicibacter minnesotensis]
MTHKQPRWAHLLIAATAVIALACTVALALQTLDDHASAQMHESGVLPGSDDMAAQQGLLPGQINPTVLPDSMTDILNRLAQKAAPPPPADPLSDMADLLIWLPQHYLVSRACVYDCYRLGASRADQPNRERLNRTVCPPRDC